MTNREEIQEKIEDFFERTCITEYIFKTGSRSETLQMKKKTPVGNWIIDSVELGYFIDADDRVIISILTREKDDIHQLVSQILTERAKTVEE